MPTSAIPASSNRGSDHLYAKPGVETAMIESTFRARAWSLKIATAVATVLAVLLIMAIIAIACIFVHYSGLECTSPPTMDYMRFQPRRELNFRAPATPLPLSLQPPL